MFQSAPLTEARGDSPCPQPGYPDTHVSIRSPDRSQGRHDLAKILDALLAVSIRSPDRSQGRRVEARHPAALACVSIRSPDRSQGRPNLRTAYAHGRWFQSAPLTEARGDSGCGKQPNTKWFCEQMREPPISAS